MEKVNAFEVTNKKAEEYTNIFYFKNLMFDMDRPKVMIQETFTLSDTIQRELKRQGYPTIEITDDTVFEKGKIYWTRDYSCEMAERVLAACDAGATIVIQPKGILRWRPNLYDDKRVLSIEGTERFLYVGDIMDYKVVYGLTKDRDWGNVEEG